MPRNRPHKSPELTGAADDARSTRAGDARGFHARTTFSEWIAADGAPWRPFDDKGVLVPARPLRGLPRASRAQLFDKACERQLVKHLKTVCLWPTRDRDRTWRLGDYSTYLLEFTTDGFASVTVQFWSEPDDRSAGTKVSFGVASTSWDPAEGTPLDEARQELLRDHGFAAVISKGGRATPGQFSKDVLVPHARAVRALAREAIAILCKVLDYDGGTALRFHLHLGTRLSAGFTFDGIAATDLLKLMRRWGFPASELEERRGQPPLIRSEVRDQPFLVAFVGEREDVRGSFGMLGLRTFLRFEGGVPEGLPNAINSSFATVKASIDEEGDLLVQTPVIVHGGVTAENLEMCFKVWKETLEEIAQGLE